ncbi:hypothetical protein TD95_001378 [Thielaviopsis punctulata]|uniref:Extracellular membrane protein CFEM domain-containing protein n=1 Tax=Thielaviopsis punctulata TaxID=72032 RepID=A0A0F4Z953_9PEZI|nr:hypothetical protein TD95_001378 [Thielaviopsis punctulata]
MRYSTAIAIFAAAVSAQSTTTSSAAAASTSGLTSAEVKCLSKCGDTDMTCRAACVPVPNPNAAQANATNNCIADCPQGNGTVAETNKYIECKLACINEYYYNTESGTPTSTGKAGSGSSATGSAASATGTGSSSKTGSKTGSAASSTGTDSADASSQTSATSGATAIALSSGMALFGAVAAILAL